MRNKARQWVAFQLFSLCINKNGLARVSKNDVMPIHKKFKIEMNADVSIPVDYVLVILRYIVFTHVHSIDWPYLGSYLYPLLLFFTWDVKSFVLVYLVVYF